MFYRAQHLDFYLQLFPLLDVSVFIHEAFFPREIDPLDHFSNFIHTLNGDCMFGVLAHECFDVLRHVRWQPFMQVVQRFKHLSINDFLLHHMLTTTLIPAFCRCAFIVFPG